MPSAHANHAGGSRRARSRRARSVPVPKPFRWYVNWVRANEENAQSLERLSRTFAMIVSDPSDLLNMEGCWTISKMHTFVNQAILQTAYHRVTPSELVTYLLRAVQELEGLGELLLRRYTTQATTWNVLLALQSVKCLLNTCVHRQLFLMPWVWQSVRLYLRRVLRTLQAPLRLLAGSKATGGTAAAAEGNMVSNQLYSDTVGPNGTRLVIPRVVSDRRATHRHYFNPSEAEERVDTEASRDAAAKRAREAEEAEEEAAALSLTFADVLGMLVDAFLLIRPVLVVAAARHVFPAQGGEGIAKLPEPATKSADKAAGKEDQAATAAKAKAKAKAAAAAEDHYRVLTVTMSASTAQQTLFASWRWWGVFAGLDALMVILARYIRARRIPVVYISDAGGGAQQQRRLRDGDSADDEEENEEEEEEEAEAESAARQEGAYVTTAGGEEDGAARLTAPGEESAAAAGGGDDETAGGAEDTASPVTSISTDVPAVVSRDSLRVQQAMRNMQYTFLRDPFFTIVLKKFIYDHFFKGFLNRIPLLGSLLAFQVSYFLSMQHFSFMYSVGQ